MDSLKPNPLLRRRNSISTSVVVPTILNLQTKPKHASSFPTAAAAAATTTSSSSSSSSSSQSFTSVDFELISIKPTSYTSLKDILPSSAAVQSPKPAAAPGGAGYPRYEISISNRLVKQAAWAYLQPMSTSPDSSDRHLFRRLWTRLAGGDSLENPLTRFIRLVNGHIGRVVTRAFDWLLRTVRVQSSR